MFEKIYGKEIETYKAEQKSIYELLEEEIMASEISLEEKNERLSKLIKARSKKANIMLVGATGSGKSSTINALFDMEVAKVGVGVDPETHDISKFELDNLVIWDTPGLGDGREADDAYNNMLIKKLSELDEQGEPLIDLVLVILDSSSKDLGTSYDLINHVIVPCLGEGEESRVLIALNQADMAMKGKHWDFENNCPDEILLKFLKEKVVSVQKRIKEGTGLDVHPIFYCAGYKEEGGEQCQPYNLTKLLYYIVRSIPASKRLAIADNINVDKDMWLYDDEELDYKSETKGTFLEFIRFGIWDGASTGSDIGEGLLGIPGRLVGGLIGGACGLVAGFFEGIFG